MMWMEEVVDVVQLSGWVQEGAAGCMQQWAATLSYAISQITVIAGKFSLRIILALAGNILRYTNRKRNFF
jgi:hypothetical protein